MAFVPEQQINTGLYVPTTNVWDVTEILALQESDQLKELLVRLYQNLNVISLSLNMKDSGFYLQEEFVTGEAWFNITSANPLDLRGGFRKSFDLGAIGAGVTNVPHGLTIGSTWSFTRILGAVSNTTTANFLPLPYASPGGANNIEIRVNATDIIITNNSGLVFTTGYAILWYLKV